MKKELLSEQNYQNTNNKLRIAAFIIWGLGLLIGGGLILSGLFMHSEDNKAEQRAILEAKKAELKNKGVVASRNYEDGEAYDLYVITNALDPSFSYCSFDEYKDNSLTSAYCASDSGSSSFRYPVGGIIMVFTGMVGLMIFMMSKQRNMMAYQMQSVMPLAQEGLEKMAPTVTKVGKGMAKEMAPVYGEIAKEISKGIKEGLKEDKGDE
ncbi:MAG: hypothetical protein IJO63_04560 [Bacilli bacterium]|nr:hypothetical protein [Bacilli bacterium]